MNRMKKFASLLLALVMALALAAPALAEETGTGRITVDNAIEGADYTLYKLFDLSYSPSGDGKAESFSYTIKSGSPWYEFVTKGTGKDYITLTEVPGTTDEFYVQWKDGKGGDDSDDAAAFAKAALAYAKVTESVKAVETKKATKAEGQDEASCVFENVGYGYYLLDSSVGALCALNSAKPDATVREKNEEPTIDKQVKDGQTNGVDNWTDKNNASIGDTVDFKVTIHAKKGAEKYVMHDTMTEGLTFNAESVVVTVGSETLTKGDKDEGTGDYYLIIGNDTTDEYTFKIEFTQTYLNSLTEDNTDIIVTYSAILNENAVIYNGSNDNTVKLTYGDDKKTEEFTTKTFTYEFDLVKTNKDKIILTGAEFELYKATKTTDGEGEITYTLGEKIDLVEDADETGKTFYRVATDAEKAVTGFQSATITAGHVTIKGLGKGDYALKETKSPDGYNLLKDPAGFSIEKDNLTATVNGETYVSGGVQVINNTGNELPATGGIGTTIFYVVGSVLALGAVILLVTKKRMSTK